MRPTFNKPGRPPAPGPREPIKRVRANQTLAVLVLSRHWHDYQTHWDAKANRSLPCTLPVCQCIHCQAEKPTRWRAYVHVLIREQGVDSEAFLELTPGLAELIESEIGVDQELRGQRWILTRGNGAKARVKLTVQAHYSALGGKELPEERSPEMDLMRLWGLVTRRQAPGQAG